MPKDVVSWMFPAHVLESWSAPEMADVRAMVLAKPFVPHAEFSAEELKALAWRVAIERYLRDSYALGLFRGREGKELLARLRANNVHHYRGAMAECIAAWWLGSVLRFPLSLRPKGAGAKILEFEIQRRAPIAVEVKAPYRPTRYRSGQFFIKDPRDTDHIGAVVTCIKDADKKFHSDRVNCVVLVPSLDWALRPAVIRVLEEDRKLAIDAVMIIDLMWDNINPSGSTPGESFFMHRCEVIKNRHRNPPGDSFWRNWPVYQGPRPQTKSPVYGNKKRRWVRMPAAYFEGRHIVLG